MGKITFNRTLGGLGRPLPSKDNYSGLIFYSNSLPSGFASNDRIKKIFSVTDAENLGIVDDYSDETKGTGGEVQITTAGTAGDTWTIAVEAGTLGTYLEQSGDAAADIASGLVTAVNARTYLHGWVATLNVDTVELAQPDGLGIVNNSAGITGASSGTGTASVTQMSSGVGSYLALLHYQISEFFRMQPKGNLWVGIFAQGTYDGTEIKTMQDYAEGEIRQIGVFITHETFAASHVTASQTYATTLEGENKPLSVLITADFTGITFANLADMSTLNSKNVSAVIGQDGNWNLADYSATQSYLIGDKVVFQGATYVNKQASTGQSPYEASYWTKISDNLVDRTGFTVATLGNALGTVALTSVAENIGWVAQFNLVSGNTLDVAGLVTGDNYKDLSAANVVNLDNLRYVYLRKYLGNSGTFYADSPTAILASSDYAYIENNRTIDKAIRGVRTFLLPKVNSPLFVRIDGTLSEETIADFKNEAERALDQMVIDSELSSFSVDIDPTQNVLTSSKVVISAVLVPVGVAREIEVNIGFAVTTL